MGILNDLGTGPGYLKMGLQGFAASGKTYTAGSVAIGLVKHFKLTKPVAMFDTEGGSPYLASRIKAETGKALMGVRARSLKQLLEVVAEAEQHCSVLIVDSVTHVWKELCDSFLAQVNAALAAAGKTRRIDRLEFQHWAAIKSQWGKWTDAFLNSQLHVVICGRAGYEYEYTQREDGSGKDLEKVGIKMKAEGEFGYEPSLLVEMERVQEDALHDRATTTHRATVLKCRFGALDGATIDNPTFDSFLPHISRLAPGTHAPVDVTTQTPFDVDPGGADKWAREKKNREIYCEELSGELAKAGLSGTSADAVLKRTKALEKFFGTSSKTAIESMPADELKARLDTLREELPHFVSGIDAILSLTTPAKPTKGKKHD